MTGTAAKCEVLKNKRLSMDPDSRQTNLLVRVTMPGRKTGKIVQVLPFCGYDGYECRCRRGEFYSDGTANLSRMCIHIKGLLHSGILAGFHRQPDFDDQGRPVFYFPPEART